MARVILASMLVLLAVAGACAAASARTQLSAASLVDFSRVGWKVGGADPDATTALNRVVTIALKRQRLDELTTLVDSVSNPRSEDYTKYMTAQELAAITMPAKESLSAVSAWLATDKAGVSSNVEVNPFTRTVTLRHLTVGQASALFGTTFHALENSVTGQTAVVGEAVNVPEAVAPHVEAVYGIHGLPLPPRRNKGMVGAPDMVQVTPSIINHAYNISGVKPTGSTANRQAVAEFQGQLLSQTDLTTFFKDYVPKAAAGDDMVYKYAGDKQQGEGVEANLDIQYIMGVAPGIKTEAWQYAGMDFCSDLKQWTQEIISTQNPPNVFSVSYGWQGALSSLGCSSAQVASIDEDFKTITGSGISIIFASGDSGSGYTSFFGLDPKLYPSWPASSAYVTAVGATRFINQAPDQGEQASDQFGSGGGFSRIVTPAPAWQTAAIAHFYTVETKAPNKTTYGFGGRGTPDVAALGEGFQVIINGAPNSVGGTSAAAPTFSAIVSLLNEARHQAGKKPLGLLNQWIYQNPSMLTDVTVGNDRIARSGIPVPLGFDCEVQWDPVTGYGTADFTRMLKAAMSA